MAVLQRELTLGEAADLLSRALPGHRVEILQGRFTATPPPDGPHALSSAPQSFERGQSVAVPESVGVRVELSVHTLLDGDG
ncbi:hypothetical protein ABZ876_02590 [Streptomyces sp. NPDC046931]|uniref:hypothetical protein n=1 Tax=Streptomyces sp. NPDC046931 TaxID=3154806 RepID=UPI0033F4FEE2